MPAIGNLTHARRAAGRLLRHAGSSSHIRTSAAASPSTKGDLVLAWSISAAGTTDFTTLIACVTEKAGELQLERVAVGEHHILTTEATTSISAHSPTPSPEVWRRRARRSTGFPAAERSGTTCRLARRKNFSIPSREADEVPVTGILGKGSKLIGGTIKAKACTASRSSRFSKASSRRAQSTDMPQLARRAGLQEMGLPYRAGPGHHARHLARVPARQQAAGFRNTIRYAARPEQGLACPTHILFNGGVMSCAIRARPSATRSAPNSWLAAEGFTPVQPLSGEDLMHAVARGAAYYGRARQGKGVRIRGGIARS